MFNPGKVVIVGASNVGSAVLTKLLDFQLASEIALIDINKDKCIGEALDASDMTSCLHSTNIYVHEGDYSDCKDASTIIITAGPSIKPGETPDRLILAKTNCKIMSSIMNEIVKYTKEAIIIMITNPLDVATYHVSAKFDYPREKIIGTGTMLETYRLRRCLADRYHIDPKNIHGYVLGEHGNSAFPAWSTVNIAGFGLEHVDEYFHFDDKINKKAVEQAIVDKVFRIINTKGYTNVGVAMIAARLIKSIAFNEHTILPLSGILEGEYGLYDVALSIPRMICRDGIVRSFAPVLPENELEQLYVSAKSVRGALDTVED